MNPLPLLERRLSEARDLLMLVLCWACWRFYTWSPAVLPQRLVFWLLPFAGRYAYSTSWADFRATCAWNRAGRPSNWDWQVRP